MPCELSTVAHSLADDSTISDLEFEIAIEHIDRTLVVSEQNGKPPSLDIHRLKRVLELAVQYRHCAPS